MNNIFNAALKHLSAKNYSTPELKGILEKEFSSLPDVNELLQKTIARLEELHLINDNLIANNQAQSYQHKGDRFIAQKLQQTVLIKNLLVIRLNRYQMSLNVHCLKPVRS